MGKHGPCYHCGVTSTPLWRNGPPEKPILCNACGSRWRTKGTLANYTPLHARVEPDGFEDYRVSKVKSISTKTKEVKLQKRKPHHDNVVVEGHSPDFDQNFQKGLEEDTSNRSSSGSAISYSESCVQYGSTDASDLTGSAPSIVWDTLVPSKKRTCVSRPKPSPVEKLTKDLYSILHKALPHKHLASYNNRISSLVPRSASISRPTPRLPRAPRVFLLQSLHPTHLPFDWNPRHADTAPAPAPHRNHPPDRPQRSRGPACPLTLLPQWAVVAVVDTENAPLVRLDRRVRYQALDR